MTTIAAVRHPVEDVDRWKVVFDEHGEVRRRHGAVGHTLLVAADDPNTVLILNEFPSREAADAFANDPSLPATMSRAGVSGPPRIEFYELSERVTY